MNNSEKILILDFGSQVTQLIARRVRESGVYSEIFPYTKWKEGLEKIKPKGIILSGGPASTIDGSSPQVSLDVLDFGVPILGICYGQQTLCSQLGGKVEHSTKREFGRANIKIIGKSDLFRDFEDNTEIVWMSHGDKVEKIPQKWKILARSSNKIIAAISNHNQTHVATQFHPEVYHTTEGRTILDNFLFKIAKCKPNWTPNNFIKEKVKTIKKLSEKIKC